MLDIQSDLFILLGGVFLLENCRDYILNKMDNCSEYDPIRFIQVIYI